MDDPKFWIFKRRDSLFYFGLRATSGEILLGSKGFDTKVSCRDGIGALKRSCTQDANYMREKSKDGEFYFSLFAPGRGHIGTSEMYSDEQRREKVIAAVRRDAPGAPVEDVT